MATSPIGKEVDWSGQEAKVRPQYRRIGILNGVLIGVALAAGAWIADVLVLLRLPVQLHYPSLLLGGVALVIMGAIAGWLTTRWVNPLLALIVWLAAALAATLIIGFQPTIGRNLAVWLLDTRLWGLHVYPSVNGPLVTYAFTGFALIIVLGVLAIVQNYRLEGIIKELHQDGRLSGRSLFMLLWPLIFVAGAGWTTNNIVGDKSAQAAVLVKEAIDRAQSYDGDLFQLGLQEGLNYAALQGVRDQLGTDYDLVIGGIDQDAATTFVVARFADGAWITCRVIAGQLSFCYDTAPPYTLGLASLITGQPLPEECRNCLPQAAEQWQSWLAERGARLGTNPQIEPLNQYGSHVIVRAASADGDFAIECRYSGVAPVQIESCQEIVN